MEQIKMCNKIRFCIPKNVVLKTLFLLSLGITLVVNQANADKSSCDLLIIKLKEAWTDKVQNTDPMAWAKAVETIEKLSALGKPAVSCLAQAMKDEPNQDIQALLAQCLAKMTDEAGVKALLTLHSDIPELRPAIEGGLRSRKGNLYELVLSPQQMDVFLAEIVAATPFEAYAHAEVLALFPNDQRPAAELLVKKLSEVVNKPVPYGALSSSSPSRLPLQIQNVRYLLKALAAFKSDSAAVLNQKRVSFDSTMRLWLLLALGYSGESTVTSELKALVGTEKDRYVQVLVIEAYAHCAKEEAIPLLETFMDDTTRSEYINPVLPQVGLLKETAVQCLQEIKSGRIK